MISVHHIRNSRSQRVLWLLEELALPYHIVWHQHGKALEPVQSLLAIHQLGKAPILCDENITIAETGAIFDYIIETYGHNILEPTLGTKARRYYCYWKNFAEASFMPYLAMKLVFAGMARNAPFFARPILSVISKVVNAKYLNPNIVLEMQLIENHLKENTWFAGNTFSAADILMGFMLEAIAGRMASVLDYPHINNFVDQIRVRPAYKAAMQKGNWSEVDHNNYWDFLAK